MLPNLLTSELPVAKLSGYIETADVVECNSSSLPHRRGTFAGIGILHAVQEHEPETSLPSDYRTLVAQTGVEGGSVPVQMETAGAFPVKITTNRGIGRNLESDGGRSLKRVPRTEKSGEQT